MKRSRRALFALVLLGSLVLVGCASNMAPVEGRGEAVVGTYVVKRGDTLYSIAWRNGLDFRALARWNRIDPPYLIHPGQRLRLGLRSPLPAAAPVVSAPQTPVRPPVAAAKPKPAPAGEAPPWRWPVAGKIIRRFSANGTGKQGIELGGHVGAPILAATGGRVVYAGNGLRGYGNLVIVKHDARYLTAYGYNSTLLVKEGESVQAGQKIATMGVGPARVAALHFELRRDGKPVDPLDYLPKR